MRKLKITELNRVNIPTYKQTKKIPLIIILDNIRSLNNVGSVFRTSDAFLIEKIYLCGITGTPPNPDIHKTALGAENSVEWEYAKTTEEVIVKLHNENYKVWGIEQVENSSLLNKLEINSSQKQAIVMGNEVKGVQQSVIDLCDGCIEIPQFGTKHSLNISVTTGIVIWDFFKKMNVTTP